MFVWNFTSVSSIDLASYTVQEAGLDCAGLI
jgi:hypothetical protein